MTRRRKDLSKTGLGVGIYTVADAARLLRKPESTVRRWVEGYSYRQERTGLSKTAKPLIRKTAWDQELSFLEFMELFSIRGLHDEFGLSMQSIRRAADYLASHYPDLHQPLASRRLETDGRDLWITLIGKPGKGEDIVNLSRRGQSAFTNVIRRYLRQVDFDKKSTLAERWWPLGKRVPVVVDPAISFGTPHVRGTGIPTRSIWGPISAGDDPDEVARWFGIPVNKVKAAIRFEKDLRREAGSAA